MCLTNVFTFMDVHDGVDEVNEVTEVVKDEPKHRQVVQLPENSPSDNEYHIIQNGQGHHRQPLRNDRCDLINKGDRIKFAHISLYCESLVRFLHWTIFINFQTRFVRRKFQKTKRSVQCRHIQITFNINSLKQGLWLNGNNFICALLQNIFNKDFY